MFLNTQDSLPPSSNSWHSREELTLHIPVHDTEKAGLGVSVKGKTCSNLNASGSSASSGSNGLMKHDGDLGIFVKNVIHGGAASRDGRLRMNDQLLSVNGVSLRGQNNAEAMETLRRAMVNTPGKHPGTITLLVGRKILRSASSSDILDHSNSHSHSHSNSSGGSNSNGSGNNNNSSSNASDNSGATVIYLSPEKREQRCNGGGGGGSAGNEMNRWVDYSIYVVQLSTTKRIVLQMEQSRFGSPNRWHLLLEFSAAILSAVSSAAAASFAAATAAASPACSARLQQCSSEKRELLHGHQ